MDCDIDWLCDNFCDDFASVELSGTRLTNGTPLQPGENNSLLKNLPYDHKGSQLKLNVGSTLTDPASYPMDTTDHTAVLSLPCMYPQVPDSVAMHEGMVTRGDVSKVDLEGNTYDLEESKPRKKCLDINKNIHETVNSQPDSYTGIEQADSTADFIGFKKRDQKRRPKPKDGTSMICQICGDRALGYNFDAITCESCKAFFRRNALKSKVFTCSFEGNCKLDAHTRKFCSGCRLKKCFEVGMKKDWILTDDQLAKRRRKSNQTSSEEDTTKFMAPPQQITPVTLPQTTSTPSLSSANNYMQTTKLKMYSPQSSCSEGEVSSTYMSDSTDNSLGSPTLVSSFSPPVVKRELTEEDFPCPLPPDVVREIESLELEYKNVFDSGYSEHQAKKIVEKPTNANDLFNMTDIFIRRLIKFAKHIPEFKCLKQEDQIFLLKGGIMEIMVLRSAMGFDPNNHKWKVKQMQELKEHGIDPAIIREQLGSGMYTEHMKFVGSLHQLTRSNRTIMTLLFVIEIFSPDRPGVTDKEAIAKAQEKFTMWLQLYLKSIMSVAEAKILYPKLLVKLLDVRNLGESSAKLASHLDITKLEPLLIEVFSLQK